MRVIALDFETALLTGEPSVQFYRDDFRAITCAFAWRDGEHVRERCSFGEATIGKDLGRLTGALFLVYNAQFDVAVWLHRFPNIPAPQWVDVMRLVQNADNGGETGFSLQAAVKRWLPIEYHDHKEPYYALIRAQGVKRGKEGANLHLLTKEQLGQYNSRDAVVTLALYERLVQYFTDINHDWTIDHDLYKANVPFLIQAEGRGILVDRHQAQQAVSSFDSEIAGIERRFLDRFSEPIANIEAKLRATKLASYKTERGRLSASLEGCEFNIGSTTHLKMLFCDELGMAPRFFSDGGAPSFKKDFLNQWGDGGMLLSKMGGTKLARKQAMALVAESELDGRYHITLKAVGTKTGRMAGARMAKINAQGMARRNKELMHSLLADPGCIVVSVDLASGEPSATSHYSRDRLYNAASFDMVGKAPYWDGDVLMIGDIYLMTMSMSPMGREIIQKAMAEGFNGEPFETIWLRDPDEIAKGHLKTSRALHKSLCLGLSYGMGADKLVVEALKAGFVIDKQTAKAFKDVYWKLFKGVDLFGKYLIKRYKKDGYLVNEFGYRLVPEADYKCLNAYIQSTVSGIIAVLTPTFFDLAPYCEFQTIIHDELVFQCPIDRLEDARKAMIEATEQLNTMMNWTVKIRTGFVSGETWYEAK